MSGFMDNVDDEAVKMHVSGSPSFKVAHCNAIVEFCQSCSSQFSAIFLKVSCLMMVILIALLRVHYNF